MSHHVLTHDNIFQRKVPLWIVFAATGLVAASFLFARLSEVKITPPVLNPQASSIDCNTIIRQQRMKEKKFTSKLLFVETNIESDHLNDLKASVELLIDKQKSQGMISSASVYLRRFGNTQWMSVNPDEAFYTASLIKVAVLITILKMSEDNPGWLDKLYPYRREDSRIASQTFADKTIIPGEDYKIRELLFYMIVYSDNNASSILHRLMDKTMCIKLFSDIGIDGFNPDDQYRKLKASDAGKLFRLLYNSSYLSDVNSEYALSLLAQSTFKDGLVKELPPGVTVAHKFGEGGTQLENQLCEAGIVYAVDAPYLIVVMTRGKQLAELSQSISGISKDVYDFMNAKKGS